MSAKTRGPGVGAEVGSPFVHGGEHEYMALFLVVAHFSPETPVALSAQEGGPPDYKR